VGASRFVLAAVSGILASLSLPPWNLGWLAFIALVPFLWVVGRERPVPAAVLGFVHGLAFYLVTIWWVVTTMTTYGRMSWALAGLALILLAAILAGYTALFAGLVAAWRPRNRLAGMGPILIALLWAGLEVWRGQLFSGFPWMLLGYSQYQQPTLRLAAAVTSVTGLSALVVLVNATLTSTIEWLAHERGRQGAARSAAIAGMILAGVLAAAVGYGQWFWRDPAAGRSMRVALLQGNIDQSLKWDRAYQAETLDIYERLVRRAAVDRPALIVWPETAAPFFLRREPELAARVAHLAVESGAFLLVGAPDLAEDGQLHNSAFLVAPDGQLAGRYDKRHLVPFGEYVPLRWLLFFVDKLAEGIGDFGPGGMATVLSAGGGRFGVMICYEAIFPGEVREFAIRGAQLLVNITNDAWFGRSGAAAQHLAMAAMRAVETGSYLLRAANTGISAVVDPSGAIRPQTPLFTEAVVTATIRLRTEDTPYLRYGDLLGRLGGLLACAGVLGALGRIGRSAWRRPAADPGSTR
jgi:apolipoprotein N-acyltransferase